MGVLLVGGGGRVHALAGKLPRSPVRTELICAPGNAGTLEAGLNVAVKADDVPGLVRLAKDRRADLVVVGPEAALVKGLADELAKAGIPVFGPSAKAAELEGSKAFSKAFMQRHRIPTAAFGEFTELGPTLDYLRRQSTPQVIKADGLA